MIKNNHTMDSVTFSKGIFVDYNVNLIHKGSVWKNRTIVLLLLKMVDQYSNARGSWIDFPSLEGNSLHTNSTILTPYLSATVISKWFSINWRPHLKKWQLLLLLLRLFYYVQDSEALTLRKNDNCYLILSVLCS
jgi:hypothetical protein